MSNGYRTETEALVLPFPKLLTILKSVEWLSRNCDSNMTKSGHAADIDEMKAIMLNAQCIVSHKNEVQPGLL